MNNRAQLNEKWLKSSIIGTVWASSEIVLGSFLHNLRVPFSGSLLTAIAILILVSVSFVWKERGIIWRAGIICALMKTLSPSAVIFGPMIAIIAEAMLLELSIRIFGRSYLGFIAGSVLAVTWSFAQKIINFLIFYGFNIVEVYKSIMAFTEKQLNLQFDTLWIPIFILLSIYLFIGIFSAILGIRTGKKLISQPLEYKPEIYNNQSFLNHPDSKKEFGYSLTWLVINLLFMVTALLLISLTNWKIWTISVVVVTLIWIIKYKRALRQILRPKFWIFFIVITMLAAFVFTALQSKSIMEAVLIGIEMNFRATVLILGFSVLGTELYNPKIRDFFSRTYFKNLPLALELSVGSLPLVIANIPDFKTAFKNPGKVILQLIAYSEFRFKQLSNHGFVQKIFIVTGKIDEGKTGFIKKLAGILKEKKIRTGGIYSQKILENNERTGYDVVDVRSGKSEKFLRAASPEDFEKIGIFSVFPRGLEYGLESLKPENNIENEIVIIDEVGNLELSGGGWAGRIEELLILQKNHLLMVIREDFVDKAIEHWNLKNSILINPGEMEFINAADQIIGEIQS
jgi:nucleoside-triphosphatase THEP1